MDFTHDEETTAAGRLARDILTDRCTPDRLRAVETSPERTDTRLWQDLASAGLLGLVLPEEDGGAGLGPLALTVLLQEQGRHVAPVPLWSATVAALAVAAHGDDGRRSALLPDVVAGRRRIALALEEFGPAPPAAPRCTARQAEDGTWALTGEKAAVPSPWGAEQVLVSATAQAPGGGPGLFLVESAGPGVSWERAETTTRDLAGHLTLSRTPAQPVGRPGDGALDGTLRYAALSVAALQLGVGEGALEHATTHLRQREQFGRPLGSFQAVQHRLADCWIDLDALRVTVWQAACALEEDDPGAARAVRVAHWWASEAGGDVVHRVQHLHGGTGVDIDHPVHRHFLWGRQLAGTLGSAGAVLEELGADLSGAGAVA